MNENIQITSLTDAVALGLDLRQRNNNAVVNLYTAVRNRLRAADTTNMHDPILLHPIKAGHDGFRAAFTDPATGRRFSMVVKEEILRGANV